MTARRAGERILVGLLVAVVLALVVGQVLGQPVLLSYVETGSMAPTIERGDGFVAVPMAVAGPVKPGDVVVFRAERLHGGGLVTHRVVGETERGFVTKGDANPVTDQESSAAEPPVPREQMVAKALQVGGRVVVVPEVGSLAMGTGELLAAVQGQLAIAFGTRALLGTQGIAILLFVAGVAAYLLSVVFEGGTRLERERVRKRKSRSFDATLAIGLLAAVLIAVVTASMAVPSGTQGFGVVSSDTDAPGAGVIPSGESENTTYRVPSNGVLPVVVFLEPGTDGLDVAPRELHIPGGSAANATVTLHAPPETGYYRFFLVEHRYLAVLPRSTIRSLYAVHPWLPILVIDGLVGAGFVGLAVALVGLGPVRVRSRKDVASVPARLRRWFR